MVFTEVCGEVGDRVGSVVEKLCLDLDETRVVTGMLRSSPCERHHCENDEGLSRRESEQRRARSTSIGDGLGCLPGAARGGCRHVATAVAECVLRPLYDPLD